VINGACDKDLSLVEKVPRPDLISLVITTYNRSDALVAVLCALAAQDDRDFEVVLADDGSTEEHQTTVRQAVRALGLTVTHVWHPDVGFTAARVRNLGVSAARGDYVVFVDGDCVPETDFVRRHRQLRQRGYFVNGSRVLLSAQLTASILKRQETVFHRSVWYWLGRWAAKDANKLTGVLRLPDWTGRRTPGFRWRGIRSCNMGVWRVDFELVNGFDESFVGWGHEDADFVLRLHNAGVVRKNGYCATEVFHLWHPESSRTQESLNAQKVRQRQETFQVQADLGYHQCRDDGDVRVHSWG
jgi:glycosyltransferase involved in cell wall biosynthesis